MNVGLFFGSFNPVHNGHLTIAREIIESQVMEIEEVWFVISPQNPLKNIKYLLPIEQRFSILEMALQNKEYHRLKICDIELHLPQPSYTVDTLNVLKQQYPSVHFTVIVGEDCLSKLQQWKNFEELSKYPFLVYPRAEQSLQTVNFPFVKKIDKPLLPISSTQIRENVRQGLSVDNLVPANCIPLIHYVIGLQLWQHGHLAEAYNAISKSVEASNGDTKFTEALLLLQQILNFEKTVPETF